MSAPIKGYSSENFKNKRFEYVTIQRVREQQHGIDVLAHQFVRLVGADAVEANSTTTQIVATAHAALAGDIIRFTSGTHSGREVKVDSVSTNAINLAEELSAAPSAADTFDILRHKYPMVDANGRVNVDATVSEIAVYAEDSAHTSGDDGKFILGVRKDAAGAMAADGDYHPFQMNANGELKVAATITESAIYAEDTAHADGDNLKAIAAVRRDANTSLVGTDGDYAPLQVGATGELKVGVTTALPAGNANIGDVDIASIAAGDNNIGNVDIVTLPGSLTGYVEDAAHSSGDVGLMGLAVRRDANTSLVDTDGDYAPLQVGATGELKVGVTTALPAGTNNIGDVDVLSLPSIPAGTNNIGDVDVLTLPGSLTGYAEDAAHSSGHIGIMPLAVRNDTPAALAGTDGDYIPLTTDNRGNLRSMSMNALVPYEHDYIGYTATDADTDTYVYKRGGSGGTTVATVTIDYTDATKATISAVTRT